VSGHTPGAERSVQRAVAGVAASPAHAFEALTELRTSGMSSPEDVGRSIGQGIKHVKDAANAGDWEGKVSASAAQWAGGAYSASNGIDGAATDLLSSDAQVSDARAFGCRKKDRDGRTASGALPRTQTF
jgi:hypothetical protein